jgi:two-component system CheB/CheR fusion protein
MLGWTHLLGLSRQDDRVHGQALAALQRGVAIPSPLIDDLLAVSRIIAGKIRLDLHPLLLGPVVEAAVGVTTAAAPPPQPAISVTVDDPPRTVLGDRPRLEQVACNLLSNAVKFTPPEGRVDVRVQSSGSVARIVVADTGCGIPGELLPRLFDEFWQETPEAAGSREGLGLTISRALVEMPGGTIRAESAGPGHGATFRVELPVAVPAGASGPEASGRTARGFARAEVPGNRS